MLIQKTTKYITSDKKEFTNKDEAKQHENMLNASARLMAVLEASVRSSIGPTAVINHLLLEHETIKGILHRYGKGLPKEPKTVTTPKMGVAA